MLACIEAGVLRPTTGLMLVCLDITFVWDSELYYIYYLGPFDLLLFIFQIYVSQLIISGKV